MTDFILTYDKTMGLTARIKMSVRDLWFATYARIDALRIFRPRQDDGPDLDMLLAARARRLSARTAVDRLLG